MKKNGFTLVELLGVMIILMVIFLLVFPSVQKILDDSKSTTYQKQINTILDASYNWSLLNSSSLPQNNDEIYITLSNLKHDGLIDSNLINPANKKPFSDDLVISITNVQKNYRNNSEHAKKYGDYLYTVIIDQTNTNDKPIIVLNGLTPDSSGNYISIVDLNEKVEKVSYSSTSKDGIDLTDKVIVQIMYNENAVNSVDTSKMGVYKEIYTVVDDNGYSSTVIRNIIVGDTELPKLTLPSNNKISVSDKYFDLMDGVVCKDNSNICDVESNGEIKFGVKGKYVIEYTAKDPSGNTTTSRRVITVE